MFRVVVTLALACVAAQACVWLRTPIPWMIGPMVATALASVAGAPTRSWNPLRNLGQWVIGAALGLYFTPEVGRLVVSLGWAILAGVVWALALGWCFGRVLHAWHAPHMPGLQRSTTYFSGAIGGASEMTLLAEREGARTDLVASAHSLRVLIVTLTIPFAVQWSGQTGLELTPPGPRLVDGLGLLGLGGLTAVCIAVMMALKRANPWFMGALLGAMVLTLSGHSWSAIPPWLSNAAQLCIGVSLGVRFTPEFVRSGPRWLVSVGLGTLLMMGLCAAFAWGLAQATGLRMVTLVLGTSPGGIAEMAITAKVLQLGVPVVTAFQVCRLVAVLLLVEPLYRVTSARPVA